MRCPVCSVRVGPCVEGDVVLEQYHAARVRLEVLGSIDHAAEADRLRRAERVRVIRERAKARGVSL